MRPPLLGIALALGFALAIRMTPADPAVAPPTAGIHAFPSAPASDPAGDACRERGAFREAGVHYRRAVERHPDDVGLRYRAFEMSMYEDPALAADIARAAAIRFPKEAPLHLCVAEAALLDALVRGTHRAAAVREAQSRVAACRARGGVHEVGGPTGDIEAVEGEIALLQGDLATARERFREAMRLGIPNPDRAVDVLNAIAWLAWRLGDVEEARACWTQGIATWRSWRDRSPYRLLEKDDTMAFYLEVFLGEPFTQTRELDAGGYTGADTYERQRHLALKADDLERQGRYVEAAEAMRLLSAAVPPARPRIGQDDVLCFYFYAVDGPLGHAADMLAVGDLLWKAGRVQEARAAYRPALALFPGDPHMVARLRYGPAIPKADAAIHRAREAMGRGDLAGARAIAIAIQPRYQEVHALLGELAARAGDYPSAASHFGRAGPRYEDAAIEAWLAVDPRRALREARRHGKRQHVAEALVLLALLDPSTNLDEAVRAASGDRSGDALATLGEARYLQGRLAEAEDAFRAALAAGVSDSERHIDVVNALGWIRFRRGDVAGMRARLHEALALVELRARDSHTILRPRWESYCTYLRVLGGEDVTVDELTRMPVVPDGAMIDQPLYEFTRDFLVDLARLTEAGRLDEAIARVERFRDAPDPPQTVPDRMLSFYSDAIEEQQDRLMVLLALGDLNRAAGHREEALRWYRLADRRLPESAVIRERMARL